MAIELIEDERADGVCDLAAKQVVVRWVRVLPCSDVFEQGVDELGREELVGKTLLDEQHLRQELLVVVPQMFGVTTEARELRRWEKRAEKAPARSCLLCPLDVVLLELRDNVDDQLVTVELQLRLQALDTFLGCRRYAVGAHDTEAIRREHEVERRHCLTECLGDDAFLYFVLTHALERRIFRSDDVAA